MKNPFIIFWNFIDNRAVVRRSVLTFTIWMTWWVTSSAYEFAITALANHYDGMSVAAIIAAIMVPTTALQGFAFKSYTDSKTEGMLK